MPPPMTMTSKADSEFMSRDLSTRAAPLHLISIELRADLLDDGFPMLGVVRDELHEFRRRQRHPLERVLLEEFLRPGGIEHLADVGVDLRRQLRWHVWRAEQSE